MAVSDKTNRIYELDSEGNVLRVLDFQGVDLEGVTYNPDDNLIAVVKESKREVTLIDYESGISIETYPVDIPYGSDLSGPEGISYNINTDVQMIYSLDDLKNEGVVIDNYLVYLVNDATSKLNIYRIKASQ